MEAGSSDPARRGHMEAGSSDPAGRGHMEAGSLDPAETAQILRYEPAAMSRPHRLDSTAYVGIHQYFLTICTYKRRPEFVDDSTVACVGDQFLQQAISHDVEILAYCFMPNHLHLVATSTSVERDFRKFIKISKQVSGYQFSLTHGRRL